MDVFAAEIWWFQRLSKIAKNIMASINMGPPKIILSRFSLQGDTKDPSRGCSLHFTCIQLSCAEIPEIKPMGTVTNRNFRSFKSAFPSLSQLFCLSKIPLGWTIGPDSLSLFAGYFFFLFFVDILCGFREYREARNDVVNPFSVRLTTQTLPTICN